METMEIQYGRHLAIHACYSKTSSVIPIFYFKKRFLQESGKFKQILKNSVVTKFLKSIKRDFLWYIFFGFTEVFPTC